VELVAQLLERGWSLLDDVPARSGHGVSISDRAMLWGAILLELLEEDARR